MLNNDSIQAFSLIFQGNQNFYNVIEYTDEKAENGKVETRVKTVKDMLLTNTLINHLVGKYGIGLAPILAANKCFYGVIDIDCYDKEKEIKVIVNNLSKTNLPLFCFRSKSGGLHIYLILADKISADLMQNLLRRLVLILNLEKYFDKEHIEIFPKQTNIKQDGCANCITLPYFNAEGECPNYLYKPNCEKYELEEAIKVIQSGIKSSSYVLNILEADKIQDAPPCLKIIYSKVLLGSVINNRNNLLFNYAIYWQKKNADIMADEVIAFNNLLQNPIELREVNDIIQSISNNEYTYKCKEEPIVSCCDKKECKKCAFGLGGKDSQFVGVDCGQLIRVMAGDPYYKWKIKLNGQDDSCFKDVIFNNEAELLDQKKFACACVRYLSFVPMQVKDNIYYSIVNKALANVINEDIKSSSDMSTRGLLLRSIFDYLINRCSEDDKYYSLRLGLSIRKETDTGVYYYFTIESLNNYLQLMKVNLKGINLIEVMKKEFEVSDTFYTYGNGTINSSIPCLSIKETETLESKWREHQVLITDLTGKNVLPIGESEVIKNEETIKAEEFEF